MADALYIGSLVLENIKPQPKGEPSIELVISSTKNGVITAEAVDMDISGKRGRQTLSVSLESLSENEQNIPDFEFNQDEEPLAELYGRPADADTYVEDEKRKFPWLLIICIALIVTAIALVLWIFLFQGFGAKGSSITGGAQQTTQASAQASQTQTPAQTAQSAAQAPATPTQPATPAQPAAPAQTTTPATQSPIQTAQSAVQAPATTTQPATPAQPATPTQPAIPVIQAPAQAPVSTTTTARVRPQAPVASYKVPAVIPKEGVVYRVRYGDTLWDIAEAFYRNPLLYPRIARFNNIRNPDRIISGSTIRVPPRN